jgi:hypothetical protein
VRQKSGEWVYLTLPLAAARFQKDFEFQLSRAERDEVVANCDHLRRLKFSRTMLAAFTEDGELMTPASVARRPASVTAVAKLQAAFATSSRST